LQKEKLMPNRREKGDAKEEGTTQEPKKVQGSSIRPRQPEGKKTCEPGRKTPTEAFGPAGSSPVAQYAEGGRGLKGKRGKYPGRFRGLGRIGKDLKAGTSRGKFLKSRVGRPRTVKAKTEKTPIGVTQRKLKDLQKGDTKSQKRRQKSKQETMRTKEILWETKAGKGKKKERVNGKSKKRRTRRKNVEAWRDIRKGKRPEMEH